MDNRVGIDCGSRGPERAMGENWDNCNRTTIKKKPHNARCTYIEQPDRSPSKGKRVLGEPRRGGMRASRAVVAGQ